MTALPPPDPPSRSKRRFGGSGPSDRASGAKIAVAVHGFVWTAEQADHSEAMLKKHYREVVAAEDAKRYWAIVPVAAV
jgi:hypothetical protein